MAAMENNAPHEHRNSGKHDPTGEVGSGARPVAPRRNHSRAAGVGGGDHPERNRASSDEKSRHRRENVPRPNYGRLEGWDKKETDRTDD